MNLFILDADPSKRAEYAFDCHLHWLAKEAAQLLSNARIRRGLPAPYLPTHMMSKISLWCNDANAYEFTLIHGLSLLDEYEVRKGYRSARMDEVFSSLLDNPFGRATGDPVDYMVCRQGMDPVRMRLDDAVEAYRAYYHTKLGIKDSTWTKRRVPEWFRGAA